MSGSCGGSYSGSGYGALNSCGSCWFGQWNSGHDTATLLVAAWLQATKPKGGGEITMDLTSSGGGRDEKNTIIGGSSRNPGKKNGYPDLMYWANDGTVYIWDSKTMGNEEKKGKKGKKEIDNYVKQLKKQLGDKWEVKPGFAFDPVSGPD
ncbi:hypothetical protein OHT93_23355 [Streptomyces sp. NBC_00191]|uniref:hypothetical protein n=1 Tax=Streptomyces sp. NBC_00191 TaxID=2975674 RepID=UPI0032448CBD